MSKIVSRGFTGYGLDLNEHGLVVKEVFLRRDGEHEAKGKIASALLHVVEHEDDRELTWSD